MAEEGEAALPEAEPEETPEEKPRSARPRAERLPSAKSLLQVVRAPLLSFRRTAEIISSGILSRGCILRCGSAVDACLRGEQRKLRKTQRSPMLYS